MSLLNERDLVDIQKFFQLRSGNLSDEDKNALLLKIEAIPEKRISLGGSFQQKRDLYSYGFYDKLIIEPHAYIKRIIETIEDEEKQEFERSRPPGTTNKPLRRRLTNLILSFLSAYYQSNRDFWMNDKEIKGEDLTGIAAAIRAQIMLANRIAINRSRNIFHAAKKFFNVARRQMQNRDGFSREALDEAQRITVILDGLRNAMTDRSHFAPVQPAPPPRIENSDDEFSDDDEHEKRKQMTYAELVRKFSMQNEKIQSAYFEARRRLDKSFDYNQFVRCRNCLAYQFLLANSSRSEAVTYLTWKEVDKAMRVKVEKHEEDDFVMVPFYDHKNCGRGIHAKKPLWLGMDRWMLYELYFLRGFTVPDNQFVFASGQSYKQATSRGMNASRLASSMAEISGFEYKDHLHWIRSSATNASCISTEHSTSQMVPDMDLVILNGHSMQTAQKHYMRLENKERCVIAARAYVKLSKKRRTAFDNLED